VLQKITSSERVSEISKLQTFDRFNGILGRTSAWWRFLWLYLRYF